MPWFIWIIESLCLAALCWIYWKERKARRAWEKYKKNISPEMQALGQAMLDEIRQAAKITNKSLADALDEMWRK